MDKKYYLIEKHNTKEILEKLEENEYSICPKCMSEIIFCMNKEDVKKYHRGYGYLCSRNEKHFSSFFSIKKP